MNDVMDKEWLRNNLEDKSVRIVDCRFSLAEVQKGRQEYEKGHLPGAVYFDLEKDLSSPVSTHGGRHPLPNIEEFSKKLGNAGIHEGTVIVAYDNGEGAYATRFWWLLQYLGHQEVYVLNGGFNGWSEANYPVTSEIPVYERTAFHPKIQPEMLATVEEVKEAIKTQTGKVILIDSREEKRYLGIEEPIDKKAGHLPGAINKPWFEGLSEGHFKSDEEQKQRFSELDSGKNFIVYCGSGITATPNFLTLKKAGFENVKLYAGSFSDWISYEENEIE